MSESKKNKKKIPLRSRTGEICVTKCKEKNELFIHPITFQGIRKDYNVCAIFPTQYNLPITDPSSILNIDACNIEDNEKFSTPSEVKMSLLTFNFDPIGFLKNVYQIHSFDDTIKWTLENNKFPFETIRRVHDCTWKVYGKNLENMTSIVYKYYYEIASNRWLKDYLIQLKEQFSFDIVEGKLKDAITSNILTYDNFVMVIKKCITENQEKWLEIVSHYRFIKKYVYDWIVEELNKTDILNFK